MSDLLPSCVICSDNPLYSSLGAFDELWIIAYNKDMLLILIVWLWRSTLFL